MSVQYLKLDYELITDTNITANEFRIFTYLLSRYNKDQEGAFPSHETISQKLNIGKATVTRAIKNLVKLGYMIVEKAKGFKGNYNVYKKLKHLIMDHEAPVKKKKAEDNLKGQLSVDDVPTVKYKNYKNTNNKVSKFNNYPQRDYDFNNLEDEILGWWDDEAPAPAEAEEKDQEFLKKLGLIS